MEIQFENINLQIQNMAIQNLFSQLQNLGMQMLNMGIQIINIGIEMPNFGLENPYISQQLKNIGNQIQNIGMNIDMKNMMQMNQMNQMMNNRCNIDEVNKWNLIFYEVDTLHSFNIQISPEKKFKEAINMYKIKSLRNEEMRFIWNGIILNPEMTLINSGLQNGSKIIVTFMKEIMGG